MKYRVKLKTTITAWVEVEVDHGNPDFAHLTDQDFREIAADDAVEQHAYVLSGPLKTAGLEHGPIELAHEELDEIAEVVA